MQIFPRCLILILILALGLAAPVGAVTLREAIKAGDAVEVERLLDAGADIEKAGLKTPLFMAAERGSAEIAALLLARGAEVDALTRWGSALHIAARRNHAETVELLLEAGADPDIPENEYSLRPLHGAAQTGAVEAAQLLLAHGADVNVHASYRASEGPPPIHLAAEKGHTEMVALLREHGAAARPVDPVTPKDLAVADAATGKVRLHECQRCHVTEKGQKVTGAAPGPNLWNVVGREIASVDGYGYSATFEALDGTWTPERLNEFLADPTGWAPGTAMYLGGESDRATRVALIAHLLTLGDAPVPVE